MAEVVGGLGFSTVFGFVASGARWRGMGLLRVRAVLGGCRRTLVLSSGVLLFVRSGGGGIGRVLCVHAGGGVVGPTLVVGSGGCLGQSRCWKSHGSRAQVGMLAGLLVRQGHCVGVCPWCFW